MASTTVAAAQVGVSKSTLLRWIADGWIGDPPRDAKGWRIWSDADIAAAKVFFQTLHEKPIPRVKRAKLDRRHYAKAAARSLAELGRFMAKANRRCG